MVSGCSQAEFRYCVDSAWFSRLMVIGVFRQMDMPELTMSIVCGLAKGLTVVGFA